MEGGTASSSKRRQKKKKQLIFDHRYGWVYDDWRDPGEVALLGGRGMFCVVPLTKATVNLVFQQVARVLHLLYRLVVQPNTSRATMFAETFISCGGIEMLLFLLKKEAEAGDGMIYESSSSSDTAYQEKNENVHIIGVTCTEGKQVGHLRHSGSQCQVDSIIADKIDADESKHIGLKTSENDQGSSKRLLGNDNKKMSSARESFTGRTIGGISFSISAESARNNFYNVDNGDGIMVGIISLVGALVAGGQLKFSTVTTSTSMPSLYSGSGHSEESNQASTVNNSFSYLNYKRHFKQHHRD